QPVTVRNKHGAIRFAGQERLARDERGMRQLRGNRIAMVFQDPLAALNPLLNIGEQIDETLRAHGYGNASARRQRILELLDYTGLPDPQSIRHAYPFQLSGGQRQRVVIAMALALGPDLLIADEPTSALDVTTQAQILELIRRIQQDRQMAMLLITHDFGVVRTLGDRVLVLGHGQLIEQGPVQSMLDRPQNGYTRELLDAVRASPSQPRPDLDLDDAPVILRTRGLSHSYLRRQGLWKKQRVTALEDASITLKRGETLGIVGESGSGKSTLGRLLLRLLDADQGEILYQDIDLAKLNQKQLRPLRGDIQMIFQDPG